MCVHVYTHTHINTNDEFFSVETHILYIRYLTINSPKSKKKSLLRLWIKIVLNYINFMSRS